MRKTAAELSSVLPGVIDLHSGASSLCHHEPGTTDQQWSVQYTSGRSALVPRPLTFAATQKFLKIGCCFSVAIVIMQSFGIKTLSFLRLFASGF